MRQAHILLRKESVRLENWTGSFRSHSSANRLSGKPKLMKTLFSLLLTFVMATPALAQGRVRLVNDSLHLVYWSELQYEHPSLAGHVYLAGQSPPLTIELWAGTSSTVLSLQATTDFSGQAGAAGTWPGMNVTLPTAAGPTFFQIEIYDTAAGSYAVASTTSGHIFGTSGLFAANSSSTIAYNSLVNHNSPANSTWADGTWNLDSDVLPGARGAVQLFWTPEPSISALTGLGAAMLLLSRRIRR
jgi:hypothetical protein